tara:strand:- start:950 stop:6016 length:5067 start_codon:yes stop_codon:yes gene_type:complete
MTCTFAGQSLDDGSKGYHSITTSHPVFVDMGMNVFTTGNILEIYNKQLEENAIKIYMPFAPLAGSIEDNLFKSYESLFNPLLQLDTRKPVTMIYDQATRLYKEDEWGTTVSLYKEAFDDAMASGAARFAIGDTDTWMGRNQADLSMDKSIWAAAIIAEEYNIGALEPYTSDTATQSRIKILKKNWFEDVQTSLSGCLTWDRNFNFVFDGAGNPNSASHCASSGIATFEMRLFDHSTPRKNKRKLVLNGAPTFSFIPSHPWGSTYAGNSDSNTNTPGQYPALEAGGSENPQNNVAAELDVYYDPNTGKAKAGTKQILARVLDAIPRAKIPPVPLDPDTLTEQDLQTDTYKQSFWASGWAMPVTVHNGNPNDFGPVFKTPEGECQDNEKEKIMIINRTQKSFPAGRLILCQEINGEWIPIDFGDDAEELAFAQGRWNFQYLVADNDTYFKDDRHYYEEWFNEPELAGSISPAKYESLFKKHFYSTFGQYALSYPNVIDEANAQTVDLFGYVSNPNCPTGPPTETRGQALRGVPVLDALNGGYVLTEVSSSTPAACYTASAACQELPNMVAAHAGGPADSKAYLFTKGALDEGYSGDLVLKSKPTFGNHSLNKIPMDGLWTIVGPLNCLLASVAGQQRELAPGRSVTPFNPSNYNAYHTTFQCIRNADGYEAGTNYSCVFDMPMRKCVDADWIEGLCHTYLGGLIAQVRQECNAAEAAAPKEKVFEWQKAAAADKFVGSRRYLNVTSFDLLAGESWGGLNGGDWLGWCNPYSDLFGSIRDDVDNVGKMRHHKPFWGAVFPDGYTDDSVNSLLTRLGTVRAPVANIGTSQNNQPFIHNYIQKTSSQDFSPNRAYGYNFNGATSIHKIYTNGDVNLTNLPADVALNASPSGVNGTPIHDFHRMVNLVNVASPGTYDAKISTDNDPTVDPNDTVDWGNNGSSTSHNLVFGCKTYFATKKYVINGQEFDIPDRYGWMSSQSILPPTQDDNGKPIDPDSNIGLSCMDSAYDLEPVDASRVLFMPLTAEWIAAFDHQEKYHLDLQSGRQKSMSLHAYDDLGKPTWINANWGDNFDQGTGWGWYDVLNNGPTNPTMTINRLQEYPLNRNYYFGASGVYGRNEVLCGTTPALTGSPSEGNILFPDGPDYVATGGGTFGRRGNGIFTIGRVREHSFYEQFTMVPTTDGGSIGAPTSNVSNGGFIEPPPIGTYIDQSYGARLGLEYISKEKHGFPYNIYLRHHHYEQYDNPISPLSTWYGDAADVVGIIAGKTTIRTSKTTCVATTNQTVGADGAVLALGSDPLGQYGGSDQSIQGFGNTHVYGRCFESWPDNQTLFDPRYFAVMHFNPGQLMTDPGTKELKDYKILTKYNEADYKLGTLETEVDYRVPTYLPDDFETNTNVADWKEVPLRTTISSDMIDVDDYKGANFHIAPTAFWKVATIRRGALLPFSYRRKTISLGTGKNDLNAIGARMSLNDEYGTFLGTAAGSYELDNFVFLTDLTSVPQTGKGYTVGNTLTMGGGKGDGAQIRVTEVDPTTGAILDFELVTGGSNYEPTDFMPAAWLTAHSSQTTSDYISPIIFASEDAGVTGTGAVIACIFGKVTADVFTDEAPQTKQANPQRLTALGPSAQVEGWDRQKSKTNSVAMNLAGADGQTPKSYDVFLHYKNDITSVLANNNYTAAGKGAYDSNPIQYVELSLKAR